MWPKAAARTLRIVSNTSTQETQMTRSSTATYEKTRAIPADNLGVVASIAVALVVGMALGFLISNVNAPTAGTETAQAASMSHEQFLRVNIEELEHLAPIAATAATTSPATDPFIFRNVDSYGWLAPTVADRNVLGPNFYEINFSEMVSGSSSDANAPDSGIITNSEPFGHPNYGRLETHVGAQPEGGIR